MTHTKSLANIIRSSLEAYHMLYESKNLIANKHYTFEKLTPLTQLCKSGKYSLEAECRSKLNSLKL